jgi:23S rRNA (cytidine2498-2'-O)-methyltransferase
MNASGFLFVVCQYGAEEALKRELARQSLPLRLAFSRPGFVTFKLPADVAPPDFELRSVFARTYGFSLGKVEGTLAQTLAAAVWDLACTGPYHQLHAWQRDTAIPGERGFEPGLTELANEVGQIIAAAAPAGAAARADLPVNHNARSGDRVLDCVLVETNRWWIGWHRALTLPQRWPGGTPKIALPPDAVSRAYLKMTEALLWSQLPVAAGDHAVEIGSAPGGSCQALLDRGLYVTGVDPADMDDTVLAHPRFTHVRARAASLKRQAFAEMQWLFADANVAPQHTLETVEHIVTNQRVRIRGLLLTLKLPEWKLADEIPSYLDRIRAWGYTYLRVRQLAFNRQEVCVAALRSRSLRRTARGG